MNGKTDGSAGTIANPSRAIQPRFGSIWLGEELHLHSNGIGFSRISEKYVPATTSIGKSQILMRDYTIEEFPIILLEHIEEVFYRMQRQNKLAQTIHFPIGYSKNYAGETIRSINVSLTSLINKGEEQISLFDNVIQREKEKK